jgi:hypothetical protein
MESKNENEKRVGRRVDVYIEGSETETPRKAHIVSVGVPERSVRVQLSYQPSKGPTTADSTPES